MSECPIIDIENWESIVNLYPENSPERTLANYLAAWCESQWTKMYEFTQLTWKKDNGIGKLKQLCNGFRLLGAEIKGQRELPGMNEVVLQDIIVTIHYKLPLWAKKHANTVQKKNILIRLICETEPYKTSPSGKWGVNPISALRKA